MSYSIDRYRQETLGERIELFKAMKRLPYKQAIEEVFPARDALGQRQNSNRMARIRTWGDKGVWPLTDRDIEEGKEWGLLKDEDLVKPNDNSEEIRQYMRSNLKRPRPVPVCSYKKHVGARLPLELSEALRELPGTMSSHVLKAVSLYIDAFKEVSGETTLVES